jgi:hypothetical protein
MMYFSCGDLNPFVIEDELLIALRKGIIPDSLLG